MRAGGSMIEPRFDDDPDAIDFVRAHPDGATFEEIGDALGITIGEARRIARSAIRKLQRAEGAPIGYDAGDPVREPSETVDRWIVDVRDAMKKIGEWAGDAPLRDELLSPAGLRLHALADAMDFRVRRVNQIIRRAEVHDMPRRWYGPGDGWGPGGRRSTWLSDRGGFT